MFFSPTYLNSLFLLDCPARHLLPGEVVLVHGEEPAQHDVAWDDGRELLGGRRGRGRRLGGGRRRGGGRRGKEEQEEEEERQRETGRRRHDLKWMKFTIALKCIT